MLPARLDAKPWWVVHDRVEEAAIRVRQPDAVSASEPLVLEQFSEAERHGLFRALYLVTGSVQEAEELTQDAFLFVYGLLTAWLIDDSLIRGHGSPDDRARSSSP